MTDFFISLEEMDSTSFDPKLGLCLVQYSIIIISTVPSFLLSILFINPQMNHIFLKKQIEGTSSYRKKEIGANFPRNFFTIG